MNGLAAHTGNDNGIRLLRRDGIKARTQTEIDVRHRILRRRLPGVLQRLRADIRRDGGRNAPSFQQPDGDITVIRSHIGKAAALRHHVRQQLQTGL